MTRLTLCLAQLNFTVGGLAGNADKMIEVIQNAGNQADLIVFSELGLTGYYPMDLLDLPYFVDAQEAHLARIAAATKGMRAAAVVGFVDRNPLRTGKALHNSLAVFEDGREVFKYHKQLLPTYAVFDEDRHFEPGTRDGIYPFRGLNLAFAICEDLWNDLGVEGRVEYAVDPVKALAAAGAHVVVSINASPSHVGKVLEREAVFRRFADWKLPLVYVNQVGGNDEIQYDGNSFAQNAEASVVCRLPAFGEGLGYVDVVPVGDGRFDVLGRDSTVPPPAPTCGSGFFKAQIIQGLRDYARKCGFGKVVVGSSGGIDSAVTLALAAEALGPQNVVAITMPSRHSSEGSVTDSEALCEALGVPLLYRAIEPDYALACAEFERAFGTPPSGLTRENMQARIRGRILMEYANHFGHLLLTTGNKSEMSVGYATLYGDMSGGLNLIGDLWKTEVYALAEHINAEAGRDIIPRAIIEKAPSAELADGQRDEDSLPPYPVLDALLKLILEPDLLSADERVEALALANKASRDVQQKVIRMVKNAEFKRWQAPPIIRVHRRAFGFGRRMPLAQRFVPNVADIVRNNG
ncbi:NAD+ synthase [Methylocaldum szegediense]|uniref:Glutamine-dependent NAD(+) synthetase n=1 Tax=Methylocaldum szegediense TaxID=73780 RepID=A0ABM9I0Y5_9GAMM|nr:NAD+ synthase [Methylocaldum szegediense]CAI8808619.1 Glutamine-dependent NAD(+) synthetase [Methylocaldum szegediense]